MLASIPDYNDEPSGTGALAGSFDKSVLQISDWLTWEQNMIKIQSVPVHDVDEVRMAIEKQEVNFHIPFMPNNYSGTNRNNCGGM